MGGGRDKNGVPLYYRRNGVYIRRDGTPINDRNKVIDITEKLVIEKSRDSDREKFINSEVERAREFLSMMDAMDEFNEKEIRENAGIRWDKEHKSLSIPEKIQYSETKDELLKVLREAYGERNVTDSFVRDNDLKMVKRALATINELENKYPFMKGKITRFIERHEAMGASLDENTENAGASMYPDGSFALNKNYWSYDNPELYDGSERGFHPPNQTPESTIAHEFGHAMLNYYTDLTLEHPVSDPANKNIEMIALRSLPMKMRMELQNDVRGQISEYAEYSKGEAFAEAMADVYANGKNASVVSHAYVNTLINEIEKTIKKYQD